MCKNMWISVLMLLLLSTGCASSQSVPVASSSQPAQMLLGAQQPSVYMPWLKGKRVGLLVNQTSMYAPDKHLVDYLYEQGVDIRYIFAPEHGFRGDADAGAHIDDELDPKTRVPVVSIYGKTMKPSEEMMKNLDVVIFDIQDVGARFYTFISSMHYMMEACAQYGKTFIVLDRPNPNGDYFDGPILEPSQKSFVGMHPIPIVHGLTVAELARMINGEGWLEGKKTCELKYVPVKGYTHQTPYELPIKPSPNLPNQQSIRLYPSLCFFEATPISIGRGTSFPFQVIGYPDSTMGAFTFTPVPTKGADMNPLQKDKLCFGDDLRQVQVPKFTLAYIIDWHRKCQAAGVELFSRPKWMDKLSGTDKLLLQIRQGMTEEQIRETWKPALADYEKRRAAYLLYQ